ncbi:MAG: RDD family protein [Bacilli bacterium]|nr:RDD family protein [Bacilli bacterium]
MNIEHKKKRILSYLIDFVLPIALGIATTTLLIMRANFPWYFAMLIGAGACYLLYLLLNTIFLCSTHGYTFGSLIFAIKTVTLQGEDISWRIALVKNLYLGLIPFAIVNAVYMLVVHTERTVFDKITDTIVVDVKEN